MGAGRQCLLRLEGDALALVDKRPGDASLHVAARTPAQAEEALGRLREVLSAGAKPDDTVSLSFWYGVRGMGRSIHREIRVSPWTEIAGNHSKPTREALGRLLDLVARPALAGLELWAERLPGPAADSSEPRGGRLILWHGRPGTGKTHALQALVRGWQDWCAPHFIADPETFLGESSAYLMEVLTDSDPDASRSREWRLIVLEDSGELLSADARARTGQALSRLLNITDGLLGQGMNALVLVTTNEPVGKLHPAVGRPGRCWAEIEFVPLTKDEGNRWLRTRGSPARVDSPTPIADLYAILEDRERPQEAAFGFAA